jgi:hypothetical protein
MHIYGMRRGLWAGGPVDRNTSIGSWVEVRLETFPDWEGSLSDFFSE